MCKQYSTVFNSVVLQQGHHLKNEVIMEQDTEQHNGQIIKNNSKIAQRTLEFVKQGHLKLDYNIV